ncbi:MAG TPA: hypothetical protein PLS35_18300 [Nitrospira sp.]|nr:hypothetical protein [Nitrospira sp.]
MSLLKQSTAREKMVFMTDSSDHVTGKTGLTLTITASKNGAAFASITPTVTERGNGWYSLSLTSSHTDTLGDLALHVTGTAADPSDLVWEVVSLLPGDAVAIQTGTGSGQLNISSGVVESNLKQIDGLTTNGNNATLNLKQLNVANSSGSAIIATSSGGNGHGITATGDGTGHGIKAAGSASGTGDGINATGGLSGATNGIVGQANSTGSGIVGRGVSTGGAGVLADGGTGGSGMSILGGTFTGDALVVTGRGSFGASKGAVFTGSGGGAEIDANITGNIIGNVTGSVAEATTIGAGGITSTTMDNGALASIRNKFLVLQDTLNGPTVTATTVTLNSSNAANDDAYNGMLLANFNASGELKQVRTITDYDNATVTVTVDRPWTSNPADTDQIRIYEFGIGLPRINPLKGVALNNFEFVMYDSTNHAPATGLTVTAQRSIDGGAYAACANAVSEVSAGTYKISLASTDMAGNVIKLKFTATGADQQDITLVTQE